MTLLTYAGKYQLQSTGTVTTTSTTFGDDNVSQVFTLSETKTVLVIYAANAKHSDTNALGGIKNAINVDSADYSEMYQSAYAANYSLKNTCVWVGSLDAGEHTITGRLACNVASNTCNLTNRTLLIYIFDGDEFTYLTNSTAVTAASVTLANDSYGVITATPSAACKALCFYGVTNPQGVTERYVGKKIQLTIGGTARTDSLMQQSGNNVGNASDSNTTVYALSLTSTSTAFQGQFAGNATQTVTLSRRFMCVLFLADSTTLDTDVGANVLSSTTTNLADDTDISITRTFEGELLTLFAARKVTAQTSAIYGTSYGTMVDTVDVARSRSSPAYSADATQALIPYAASVAAGSHTIEGRFSTNYATTAACITNRIMLALWFPIYANGATYVSDTIPATMAEGEEYSVSVTVTNSGESTWNASTAYSLGGVGDAGGEAALFGATRFEIAAGTNVIPGANYTFNFTLIAPSGGSYTPQYEMVQDGVGWFGDTLSHEITVASALVPLTYKDKYIIQSGSTVTSAGDTLGNDTPATKTFTLSASQTVLVFYNANSTSGDTNNVGGFKNAINVDGTDYSVMQATGYATNYPIRNACVWVGTLASGEHTINGRFASNLGSTDTTITNRTLMIYIFDGDSYTYIDSTATQTLAASETYVDDTAAIISITPKANSKALVFYGVTNAPGTAEHYVGKKICVAVNGTDYTDCEARQSNYATGGTNSDSVATAYALALTGNTSYTFQGRVASVYTYATYISRRFLAVLVFNDTTLIDVDSSATSQNTNVATLVDDATISITRDTLGELIAFYAATKTSFTTSDVSGNRYGIMIDGFDAASSRTSQAFSGSANSALVGAGSTVYSQSHIINGRTSTNESSGTAYMTNRCLTTVWLARAVVSQPFVGSNDIKMSKAFSVPTDIRLFKFFASSNDITAQTLINKMFSVTNDIRMSKAFASSIDLRLSKAFSASADIRLYKAFLNSNDHRLSKIFSASSDARYSKGFLGSSDLKLSKPFVVTDDIKLLKVFTGSNDLKLSKVFSASVYISLKKLFSSISDVKLSKIFSSLDTIKLSKVFSSFSDETVLNLFISSNDLRLTVVKTALSDVKLYKYFSSSSDLRALFILLYASENNIKLYKPFSSVDDILLLKVFNSISDETVANTFDSSSDLRLSVLKNSVTDIGVSNLYNSFNTVYLYKVLNFLNDIRIYKTFSASSDLLALYTLLYTSRNNIQLSKVYNSTVDIKLKKVFQASLDVLYTYDVNTINDICLVKIFDALHDLRIANTFTSTNELFLSKIFSASNEVLGIVWAQFRSSNCIMVNKVFTEQSDIYVKNIYASYNAVDILKNFLSANDMDLYRIKLSRNDVRLSKTHTSRSDIRLQKIYSTHHTLWYYSIKSSRNDIQVIKNFSESNEIKFYKLLASTNDVFVTKNFTFNSKVRVDHFVASSNNIFLTKEFESINDVLEFIRSIFASTNMILLAEEFTNTSDIQVKKTFSSSNIIIRVIWDLNYPLTVVVSLDERTIVLTAMSRKVYLDNYINSVVVGATRRTVTVNQPERDVDVTKW